MTYTVAYRVQRPEARGKLSVVIASRTELFPADVFPETTNVGKSSSVVLSKRRTASNASKSLRYPGGMSNTLGELDSSSVPDVAARGPVKPGGIGFFADPPDLAPAGRVGLFGVEGVGRFGLFEVEGVLAMLFSFKRKI